MKKPKVAIITNLPSPYRIPLFEKLAKAFDLKVYFLHLKAEHRKWDVKLGDKFDYELLPGYALKYRGHGMLVNYDINFSVIDKIQKENFDAIIIGGYVSFTVKIVLFLCKLKKIPFILWSGSTLYDEAQLFRKIYSPVIKLIIKFSDAFVAYGTWAKEYIMSFNVPSEKVFIAINVGNVDYFLEESKKLTGQKDSIKQKLGIKSKYNLLYVGQLIKERKGVEYLVDAFIKLKKENKDLGLVVVGDGPQKEELEEMCHGIDNVYFTDFIQPDELPLYYAAADIFVIPSFYDRFSIVLSEAMASGLPAISTNKNAATVDLIEDGINGYVVEERSSEDIYNKLMSMLQDPENLKKMGENAKNTILKRANLDKTASGFIDAVNYTLNK